MSFFANPLQVKNLGIIDRWTLLGYGVKTNLRPELFWVSWEAISSP